jgi:glycosyltransferase involved in cell wall biosynthesis
MLVRHPIGGIAPARCTVRCFAARFVTAAMMYEASARLSASGHRPWIAARQVPSPDVAARSGRLRWTVVLAFYNEAGDIAPTLRQLALQSRPFRLVLVDNGSTDDSVAVCHAALRDTGVDYVILHEDRIAGQTAALACGLATVDTEFVATCDADTYYPSSYLRDAELLFDRGGSAVVAACAHYNPAHRGFLHSLVSAVHQVGAARLLPRQAHVGAAGQCFRTEALRRAGGYCPHRWPYLLGDHEIMHRVLKQGRQAMALTHWCGPSDRRAFPLRWSLVERALYHLVPFAAKDRYFRWLGRRFEKRGLIAARLRERGWEERA